MKTEPVVRTKEQQAATLANYLPSGRAFSAKDVSGTNIRLLLRGLADELIQVDKLIAELRRDMVPDQTQYHIDEWESAVGIPDQCFDGSGDDASRRLAITTKLSALGIQTDPDFVALAKRFGINVTVESGSVHGLFPWTFPKKFYGSEQHARFTLVVRPTDVIGESFPYTFPITFGTAILALIECLFNQYKPANVQVVFENPIS